MKSKSQIELGAAYWWQPRRGSTPELVEVIAFMPRSITRVKCKNVNPPAPYMVTVGLADGTQHQYVYDRPKGSKIGVNVCKGDVYDDVNIAQLTATKPEIIRTRKDHATKSSFDA